MSFFLKKELAPFLKKKLSSSEKVTPSEEVEKGTNFLNDMEEPAVMIHINWITFRGIIQHQQVGLILITSG